MSVALLVMTDGRRECLERAVASAAENLSGPISERWMHDDSGDAAHRTWLDKAFPEFEQIGIGPRRGFGRAIARAWSVLLERSEAPFVWHLEGDFVFNRPLGLEPVMQVLDAYPHLAQMALRRQPWNAEERAAGGVVEQHPGDYEERTMEEWSWLEHRRFFSTNPSLYHRSLMRFGWPDVEHSEGVFTHQLLVDPALRFGYWGALDSGEWVTHIGHERIGAGY